MENIGLECKKSMTQGISARLSSCTNLILSSFSSMIVSEQEELRRSLEEIDAALLVVKNRIVRRAFKQANLDNLTAQMQGLSAIATGGSDAITLSKALVKFAQKYENFKILGGYVDTELLEPQAIKNLASIPSKEVLLTQIVYAVKSPIQGLVNTLTATMKKFLVVLDRISEKRK